MSDASRMIVGPFNRVEGDLEVQLTVEGDHVKSAQVVSPLFRGFEQILQGKHPLDSLTYVPRICGICSVSQSVAAANALANLEGLSPPPNGALATNLILANENIADHLTHFYLFFMPDFARPTYANEPWFAAAEARFKAIKGSAINTVLPARANFLHIMGSLAGKWPHSLAIQPGGTTCAIQSQDKARLGATLFAFRDFLENTLFGASLEEIAEINSVKALQAWQHTAPPSQSDFRHFLHIADALQLDQLGRAYDRFMSYGAYGQAGDFVFSPGVFDLNTDAHQALDHTKIAEDISHSWMQNQTQPTHPFNGITHPSQDNPKGYTWCKAPRLNTLPVEVGALARQAVNKHPLIMDLIQNSGGNVHTRIIARLLEIALVVIEMEKWVKEFEVGEPFCNQYRLPNEAQGFGLTEAARGSLGHWIKVKRGHILNYQIIAPTTWNFSPRDQNGLPGPLERALENAPLRADEQTSNKKDPIAVQHIVRSFDPCMVCTVH